MGFCTADESEDLWWGRSSGLILAPFIRCALSFGYFAIEWMFCFALQGERQRLINSEATEALFMVESLPSRLAMPTSTGR